MAKDYNVAREEAIAIVRGRREKLSDFFKDGAVVCVSSMLVAGVMDETGAAATMAMGMLTTMGLGRLFEEMASDTGLPSYDPPLRLVEKIMNKHNLER